MDGAGRGDDMSAVKAIKALGAIVTIEAGRLQVSGLDRLPAAVAEQVLAVARARRDDLLRELSEPGQDAAATAAADLIDIADRHGLRLAQASTGRVLLLYPHRPSPNLVQYADGLLTLALPHFMRHPGLLPVMTPAEAVEELQELQDACPGFRLVRGEGGGWWPVYPRYWSVEQRASVQALWFVAGDALDEPLDAPRGTQTRKWTQADLANYHAGLMFLRPHLPELLARGWTPKTLFGVGRHRLPCRCCWGIAWTGAWTREGWTPEITGDGIAWAIPTAGRVVRQTAFPPASRKIQ